jgi:hypothetical protein
VIFHHNQVCRLICSKTCSDPWSIVSLAFFLRYPNPYAAHVISCDVIDRHQTESGSLLTTRLILKRGALPRWAPQGIISRAESWVIEESEVDPFGKFVRCRTKNLDHVKVMQVEETQLFEQNEDGYVSLILHTRVSLMAVSRSRTVQTTEAYITSRFGWGMTKRIESHGLARFKAHVQRVSVFYCFSSLLSSDLYVVSAGRLPHP